MSGQVRGWCPGAHRPMQAEDGLIVRIKPAHGRLTAMQAHGLGALAQTHGLTRLQLTSRANLQWRGVAPATYPALLEGLAGLGLLDEDEALERARNIVTTPFWQAGDGTLALTQALAAALPTFPDLPGKFGFAVDTGAQPVLSDVSADIRVERSPAGDVLVRADGAPTGQVVTAERAMGCIEALARWFVQSGGAPNGRGRMRQHVAAGNHPPLSDTAPAHPAASPAPGPHGTGMLAAFAFGEIPVSSLAQLADLAGEIRLTPWRMVLLPGLAHLPDMPGIILDPANPLPRVFACTGAPGCAQALGDTRSLARGLAPHLPPDTRLHVSGCDKGCAHPAPATVTLTAMAGGFALIRHGTANAAPIRTGLDPASLFSHPQAIFGPS